MYFFIDLFIAHEHSLRHTLDWLRYVTLHYVIMLVE